MDLKAIQAAREPVQGQHRRRDRHSPDAGTGPEAERGTAPAPLDHRQHTDDAPHLRLIPGHGP